MYKKYRRYFAALSKIEGFTNWVIAKVRLTENHGGIYESGHEDESILRAGIKKHRKNYAILVTGDAMLNLEVHLIKIISKNDDGFNSVSVDEGKKSRVEFEEYIFHQNMKFVASMEFQKNEIMDFVRDVGDKNPIHSTEKPIVPGFLMLECLLEMENISSCDIKYILPVVEGEKIEIYKNTGNLEAWVWNCAAGGYVKIFELLPL